LDHGFSQLGGAIFGAAEGGFEGVAEFHQVLNLGDDALARCRNSDQIALQLGE
jgi:hypothetical protein